MGDGPRGVVDVAQPGDLVLSAFEALAGRSVATLLWYPLEQPDEPAHWTLGVRGRLDGQLWQLTFSSGEADAGLAGCGLLAAHVSDETEAALTKLSVSLGQALARKRVGLVVEVVQSRNAAGSIS